LRSGRPLEGNPGGLPDRESIDRTGLNSWDGERVVNAFWSITMYNARRAFIENPTDRYAIGDRDRLQFNDGGSLPLYLQHESPGEDRESNWLPAAKDSFNLFMRLYGLKPEILDGTWKMPLVERVN
jgi:hypothetical protein